MDALPLIYRPEFNTVIVFFCQYFIIYFRFSFSFPCSIKHASISFSLSLSLSLSLSNLWKCPLSQDISGFSPQRKSLILSKLVPSLEKVMHAINADRCFSQFRITFCKRIHNNFYEKIVKIRCHKLNFPTFYMNFLKIKLLLPYYYPPLFSFCLSLCPICGL